MNNLGGSSVKSLLATALSATGENLVTEVRKEIDRRIVALGLSLDCWREVAVRRGWTTAIELLVLATYDDSRWEAVDAAMKGGTEGDVLLELAKLTGYPAERIHDWPGVTDEIHANFKSRGR